jgi:hypothetical protein
MLTGRFAIKVECHDCGRTCTQEVFARLHTDDPLTGIPVEGHLWQGALMCQDCDGNEWDVLKVKRVKCECIDPIPGKEEDEDCFCGGTIPA